MKIIKDNNNSRLNSLDTIPKDFLKCSDCQLCRSGECFGALKICQDFRYFPRKTREEKENWPKFCRGAY